jgi:hypothetical protein
MRGQDEMQESWFSFMIRKPTEAGLPTKLSVVGLVQNPAGSGWQEICRTS